ncbi:ABC-type dipeptide/oligopeptide/nickel transport system, permease component [Clostridium aceticum]|uniref:Nickel import system permease protein NikB n=1 Tax=Clostridium aceticum TaxID=84022 RepID=A0A0D8ICU5_9CLOT|nr:nickel/cobalt ABC transporter permease [Clostridium aceticum]AKL95257.1 ABC-type dipeptide/oligopeptide/nickel transport system, permease component [Clostridium aceticum]KJF28108.1 nickel transporter permease NikB [Clostridium aceticum]
MGKYIIKRILMALPMMLAVSFIAFVLINLIPADPAEVVLRVNEIIPTEEAIEGMREELGLNKPYLQRYFDWLWDVLHLNLGNSYVNKNRTVAGEITRSLPATFELAAVSLFIVIFVSIPVGLLCAVWKDSIFDRVVRIFIFIGTAMPNYWIGILLIWLFAVKLGVLPTGGNNQEGAIILPAITLSLTYISTYVRLIRNSILENMIENYVFYAKVRGLKDRTILLKHVLKNSLQSSITALGMSVVHLLAGTVVVENIFSWPGIGRLCITAIFNRDYPIIQAYILMMGTLFIVCNLIVDIIHHKLDPRLHKVV